jgi:hypothetical protein
MLLGVIVLGCLFAGLTAILWRSDRKVFIFVSGVAGFLTLLILSTSLIMGAIQVRSMMNDRVNAPYKLIVD